MPSPPSLPRPPCPRRCYSRPFVTSHNALCGAFVERLWSYATVAEARTGIGAWLDFYNTERQHQSLVTARRGRSTRKACGHGDDRRCRPAVLPPLPEPARKAGKCSPSPTSPQAPRPTMELILDRGRKAIATVAEGSHADILSDRDPVSVTMPPPALAEF
jgi:hypothetical protein